MRELSHVQFLELLKKRAIHLHVRDGRLHVSAPAGAVDPELRAELGRRKAALLEILPRLEAAPAHNVLASIERRGKIPQTHAQQGMWLIDYFAPGNVAYNIPEASFIHAPVEPERLQEAIDGLLARHETLRTCFYEEDGELLQRVSTNARARLGYTDLSTAGKSDADDMLRTLIRDQARRPFRLDSAPLVRFHLFRLSRQRHVMFFNIHHIIADRRSLTILRNELEILYQAAIENQPAALPDLPIQYADYAIWADRRIAEGAWESQIQYWKAKLAGAPPYLDLPSSRPYPERRTAGGATVPVLLSAQLRNALAEVGRQEGATMFMVLLAIFAVLLHRQSGEEDLCIGSPFTHRNHVGTENLIGLFVNMLVLRCQIQDSQSYREVLRSVRAMALEAYENSDVPFQELVRALKVDPRSLRSPLFQIMFGCDSSAATQQNKHGHLDVNPGTARFDLSLELVGSPEGVTGSLEYCTDLFVAADIELLVAQFVALAGQFAVQPDTIISRAELVQSLPVNYAMVRPGISSEPSQQGVWSRAARKLSQKLSHRSVGE